MKVLKIVLSIIAGAVVGSAINMGIVMISEFVIPPPAGADTQTMEGLNASIHLFEPKHFIMPFLAHALGTLTGAMVASLIAKQHAFYPSMFIGFLFLAGGVANIFLIQGPMWFNIIDLALAYIPMAWLGNRLVKK